MKLFQNIIIVVLLVNNSVFAGIIPVRLTCEYLTDPECIDAKNPRLSWINSDPGYIRNQKQTAWQIRVASTRSGLLLDKADLWNSGKVNSEESVNIIYKGKALTSAQDCWWQVRVWDKDGSVSTWSEPAFWSMGLLNPEDWKAKWIGAPWQGEETLPKPSNPGAILPEKLPPPSPMFRKDFKIEKKVTRAVAYVTGLGYFELYLNGKKVGNDVLVPNQTNYTKRPGLNKENIPVEDNFKEYKVLYLSYDIGKQLNIGTNVAGAILGNGFYNPAKYWTSGYGTPRLLLQINLTYEDGSREIIASDQTWKASKSPILMDMVYYGEHYDARLEQKGWSSPGFNDLKWENAVLRKAPEGKLCAHMSNTDRVMEQLSPVKVEKLVNGNYKVDFGQEISGWVRLSGIRGEAGRKIEIKYLHKTPSGENSYTLKGEGEETYAARFNWFVFREIELVNWPGELNPGQLVAEAVYTNIETTGKFECSNELFNNINRIWWRSQTDNMHGGIASDCPNRERSPYTGDGQVACVTVMHNFDSRAFYTKWIKDILGSQNVKTGYVPNGAPWQPGCGGGVAWGAAINIMPWEFFVQYGDTDMLRNNYEGMKEYVKYMLTWTDKNGIMYSQATGTNGKPNQWMNLGDWSEAYKLPPDNMVHTFYLWRCSDLTARTARVLGKNNESKEYAEIADRTKSAFQNKFYDTEKGSYGQYGGNIFALKMGIPDIQKARVIASLRADILANGGHVDTGIFGTQFFFEVLSENGLHEVAYEAMNQKTTPGYGWWIAQGATTTWEGWSDPGSGNHPMFGGGITWLYRKLAGMNADPEKPGYKHIIFRPQLSSDVSYASYSNMTPYGKGSISWKKENGSLYMEIIVPVGSNATVYVPVSEKPSVREITTSDGKTFNIRSLPSVKGYSVYSTGSGKYVFESKL
jgi:alpha-L-rhamnosidase